MTDRVLAASVPVRPAATVMLVRDGDAGLEVFMLQRTHTAAFARSAYVFPGGSVDDTDHGLDFEPLCDETDAQASARLGLASGGLAWLVAAIRECFEEAGVLLARRASSDRIVAFGTDSLRAGYERARHAVHDGSLSLVELARRNDLRLLTDRIHFVDHWVTPVGETRRFDTRFFVTRAPAGQDPLHDDRETIASMWVRPADALARAERGEVFLMPPTITSLERLLPHPDAESAIAWAAGVPRPEPMLPKVVVGDDGRLIGILRPGDDGYDDAPVPEYVIGR